MIDTQTVIVTFSALGEQGADVETHEIDLELPEDAGWPQRLEFMIEEIFASHEFDSFRYCHSDPEYLSYEIRAAGLMFRVTRTSEDDYLGVP